MGTAKEFELDLNKFMLKTEQELKTVVQKIAIDALSDIITITPVDFGRARSNWFVTVGTDVLLETTLELDKTGEKAIARGKAVLANYANAEGLPPITIYNNLVYINELENGSSRQAPNGMVQVTINNIKTDYDL